MEVWGCDCGTETFDSKEAKTYGGGSLGDELVPSLFHPFTLSTCTAQQAPNTFLKNTFIFRELVRWHHQT